MKELHEILAAAGPAHHQAYIDSDGEDPEWPLWYADYLQVDLSRVLDKSLTKSEIVFHLLDMERMRSVEAPDAPWPGYYAAELIARRDSGSL